MANGQMFVTCISNERMKVGRPFYLANDHRQDASRLRWRWGPLRPLTALILLEGATSTAWFRNFDK
jgi:hypothetical protein